MNLPTAKCEVCKDFYAVRKNGVMREHNDARFTPRRKCEGSGSEPIVGTQTGSYT